MSMHQKPLTELEEFGLKAHRLAIGTPSQLSDAFRQGVAWAEQHLQTRLAEVEEALSEIHLFPDDFKNLMKTECSVEVYSVAAGHPEHGRTITLLEALTTKEVGDE